jgi:Gp49-like protein DUF891
VKAAIFHPAARAAIRSFPEDVRQELGKAIYDLRKGAVLAMPLSRPLPSIEPGAAELRIRDRTGIYRAFYYSPGGTAIPGCSLRPCLCRGTINRASASLRELLYEEI